MPLYTPNSNVTLMSGVPLIEGVHQRKFNNQNEQLSYFNEFTFKKDVNMTYIKDDKVISLPYNQEELRDANYLTFKNNDFDGKQIYAFITGTKYVAEKTTHISYKVDTYQTRLFDMVFKQSYIEREHCQLYNDDGSPVINTIDEGLDYGDSYNEIETRQIEQFNNVYYVIVTCKIQLEGSDDYEKTKDLGSVNGTPTTLNYYIIPVRNVNGKAVTCKIKGRGGDVSDVTKLEDIYQLAMTEKFNDAFVSFAISPVLPMTSSFDNNTNVLTCEDLIIHARKTGDTGLQIAKPIDQTKYSDIEKDIYPDKYFPFTKERESKLMMSPYTILEMTDLCGHKLDVKLENINQKNLKLGMRSSISHIPKTSYGIAGYNTTEDYISFNESIINNTAHSIPVKNDMLSAYYQGERNSLMGRNVSSALNVASGGVGLLAGGGASVGGLGSITQGVTDIVQTQLKIKDIANLPPSINGMGNNVQFEYGNNIKGIFLIFKQIKPEKKKILSDYFNMYGYKVNRVKIPNVKTRRSWNYVKTINCNIQGRMSQTEKEELISMFNNGMTLWHVNDIGNYSLDNGVI